MSYKVEEYDITGIRDSDLEPIVAVGNRLQSEAEPRASDLTIDEFRIFAHAPGRRQKHLVVRTESGEVAGIGTWNHPTDGTSADILRTMVGTVPEHRRKGVGTMILDYVTRAAEEMGRDTLEGWHHDTVPGGAAFAAAVGATGEFAMHQNVVLIADIDRQLMETWARIGEETAPGYSVRLYQDLLPEELLDDMAHLSHVLDRDMPRADDMEPRTWTAEHYDEMQRHYLEESEALTALAFHDTSGKAVGMSQIVRRKSDPTTWQVTVTMVDPEHRGNSLGKWVKGTVNVAALERWDGGVYQQTNKAFANEPMLAINHEMGFTHELTMTRVTVPTATARAYLVSRT
ncbi:MAG TPA: GNAT family N-acetyltransferase [Acidimicrobiia bacterium]|nr:GNAT family N-acetyltransferase [Acidimicrobiia bacterium]